MVKTGLTADCIRLEMNADNLLLQIAPSFGGNLLAQIITPHHRPQMATVRPGAFQEISHDNKRRGEGIRIPAPQDLPEARVRLITHKPRPHRGQTGTGASRNVGIGGIEQARRGLIATIGENIAVRRFSVRQASSGNLASYLHGGRIGVLVELEGGDADLARDIAMHIAASKPECIDEDGVPQEMLDKERELFGAQAQASGKPAEIIEKMVTGRIRKFLGEITLLGQPFVKDPDQTVGKLLKSAGARVISFDRLELGEGVEKKTENFAEEVMAQVQGS